MNCARLGTILRRAQFIAPLHPFFASLTILLMCIIAPTGWSGANVRMSPHPVGFVQKSYAHPRWIINWIFHPSCDMIVQKNFSISIVRAMRLAYELSAWTDSFSNAHKSVREAFFMLDEKTGDTFG